MCAHKPRYIIEELCIGCQECVEACVYKEGRWADEFNLGLSKRKPIYLPFPQAVPQKVVIDPEACIEFKSHKCKKTCVEACGERKAIDFQQNGDHRRNRGRQHHSGHRLQDLRCPPQRLLRLWRIPECVHLA